MKEAGKVSNRRLAVHNLEVDLQALARRAEQLGQTFPRWKFATAPEIYRLWLQARLLGIDQHPVEQWLLRELFHLHSCKFLHGVEDILRGIYMAEIAKSAEEAEKKL